MDVPGFIPRVYYAFLSHPNSDQLFAATATPSLVDEVLAESTQNHDSSDVSTKQSIVYPVGEVPEAYSEARIQTVAVVQSKRAV